MSVHQEPNLVIFKIPDDAEGNLQFVEVPYLGDKLVRIATPFSVVGSDAYKDLKYNHVVLARTTADGSLDLERYLLNEDSTDDKVRFVYKLTFDQLAIIIDSLVKHYMASLKPQKETSA